MPFNFILDYAQDISSIVFNTTTQALNVKQLHTCTILNTGFAMSVANAQINAICLLHVDNRIPKIFCVDFVL